MKPLHVGITSTNIDGIEAKRCMIILRTRGCRYARKTGGCTVCGFFRQAEKNITQDDMIQQLKVLDAANVDGIKQVDLLTCGSFYDEKEIEAKVREHALHRISKLKNILKVTTETRAEYLTIDKLRKDKEILGEKVLEIAIGLESANDYIRNKLIKKGLSRKNFERAVAIIGKAKAALMCYVLIKPPGESEREAIEDAVRTAEYAFRVGRKYGVPTKVALEPVFVCANTPLETVYKNGEYKILNLWSVVEVIIKIHPLGSIFIGLDDENLSRGRMPKGCAKCSAMILDEIRKFNKTQDSAGLKKMTCSCKEEYEKNLVA